MADAVNEEAIGLDEVGIGRLVVKALENHGWAGVDPGTVQFTNLTQADPEAASGFIYKVALPENLKATCPNPTVSLHVREQSDNDSTTDSAASSEAAGKILIRKREEAVRAVLSELKLAPQQLVDEKNYFIETWEGKGHPELKSIEDFKKIGWSLACLHRETMNKGSWYDPILAQLKANIPALKNAQDAGFWQWRTGGIPFVLNNLSDQELVAEWCQVDLKFLSQASKRMVTCHCDLHVMNLVVMEEGNDPPLKFIDLGGACVGYAILDLAYFLNMSLCHPEPSADLLEQRVDTPAAMFRAFAEAYLQGMGDIDSGDSCDEIKSHVDNLLVDCIVGAQFFHNGLMQPKKMCDFANLPEESSGSVTSLGFFHAAKAILNEILASEEEQKLILAGLETLPKNARCQELVSLSSVYNECDIMKAKNW